jgi:metal-responsive CopG/Arc/MetJ family transcriptional regulator
MCILCVTTLARGSVKVRTHVVLPDELVRAIDTLVGRGKRSQFIEEATREKLRGEVLLSALEETAAVLLTEEHPEWATRDHVASWVRESRQQSDERLKRARHG